MGEAILSGVRRTYRVRISEKRASRRRVLKKRYGAQSKELTMLCRWADILILAVKPQDMGTLLTQLKAGVEKRHTVISIAAGVTTAYLEKGLPEGSAVIRTMPNMPAFVGRAITAVCRGKNVRKKDVARAVSIFNLIGETVLVSEKDMDAVTAVSGSGPAYVFLFMEEMIRSGQKIGLRKRLAEHLVKATFSGSVRLIEAMRADPAGLRKKVTSRGGTTQAALEVFKKKGQGRIMQCALKSAHRRAEELAKR